MNTLIANDLGVPADGVKYELMVCWCWEISTSWAGWGAEWGVVTPVLHRVERPPQVCSPCWVGNGEVGEDPVVAEWAVVTTYSLRGSDCTSEKKRLLRVKCNSRIGSLWDCGVSVLGNFHDLATQNHRWPDLAWCSLLNNNISEVFWWCLEGLRWVFFWYTRNIYLWLMPFIIIRYPTYPDSNNWFWVSFFFVLTWSKEGAKATIY